MPRSQIKVEDTVDHLSILNGDGEVDKALEPKLTSEEELYLYRLMVRTRVYDERLIKLQRQGRIGTYAPSRGQEAAHCPAALLLKDEDWVVQAFREPGLALHREWPLERLMLYWGGMEEGNDAGKDTRFLPMSVPMATQSVHAMGIAWAGQLQGKNEVVLTFCGDGATSEGDFHEALNFAGVYQLPVVFVVQNNQWAISLPRSKQTASATIAQKATAYGFGGIQVDGNDPLAVYVGLQEAFERARTGGGPTLVEAITYRMSVHTTADDPKRYRSDEEVAHWEQLDPIKRYRIYLVNKGVLTEEQAEQIAQEADVETREAVKRYEELRKADPLEMFDYVYETMPVELQEQREELRAALNPQAPAAERPTPEPRQPRQVESRRNGNKRPPASIPRRQLASVRS